MELLKSLKSFVVGLPTALSGVALAIVSLGVGWESVVPMDGAIKLLTTLFSAALILLLIVKFLCHWQLLLQDLQHPIAGSTLPTLAMAMMVIAGNLASYQLQLAQALSWFAIALHSLFFFYFVIYRSRHFKFVEVLPSWFIPPIGLVLAIITHPGGLPSWLANLTLFFGFICYALMLPIVLYRLRKATPLNDLQRPILVILATPASLLLLAYLVISNEPNALLLWVTLALALLMTFSVYLLFTKLLRLPFVPTYSAFTFPLVVGALALFKLNEYIVAQGLGFTFITLPLAYLELIVATLMTLYVACCYFKHLKNG